ncbi:MAG: glycosyltransferase [Acutalibacteraceae bacterium]
MLAQTYSLLEILVIDDGSCDKTRILLEQYGGQIVLLSQQHRGVASARNAGLLRATGDFILFVDGDDYLEPDCVATGPSKAAKKWCGHRPVLLPPALSRWTHRRTPLLFSGRTTPFKRRILQKHLSVFLVIHSVQLGLGNSIQAGTACWGGFPRTYEDRRGCRFFFRGVHAGAKCLTGHRHSLFLYADSHRADQQGLHLFEKVWCNLWLLKYILKQAGRLGNGTGSSTV